MTAEDGIWIRRYAACLTPITTTETEASWAWDDDDSLVEGSDIRWLTGLCVDAVRLLS